MISNLGSADPRRRFRALAALRDRYEPEVGEALVQNLIHEHASGVWWLSAQTTIPVWLPLLDRTLTSMQGWPFSGGRTLKILDLAQGHVLHSAEPHIAGWLGGSFWEFKFAAFRWLTDGGTMDQA